MAQGVVTISKLASILLVIGLWFAGDALASEPRTATATVRSFAEAVAAVQKMQAPNDKRAAALAGVFESHVDLERISRRVVGGHWTEAAQSSRAEMIAGLRDYLVKRLSGFVLGRNDRSLTVTSATENEFGDDILVAAHVEFSPGNGKPLAFLMSRGEGRAKIADVMVSGISAVETLSAECQSLIRRGGMPALLARLAEAK
jgi:ABC-type transporter MlaC component